MSNNCFKMSLTGIFLVFLSSSSSKGGALVERGGILRVRDPLALFPRGWRDVEPGVGCGEVVLPPGRGLIGVALFVCGSLDASSDESLSVSWVLFAAAISACKAWRSGSICSAVKVNLPNLE